MKQRLFVIAVVIIASLGSGCGKPKVKSKTYSTAPVTPEHEAVQLVNKLIKDDKFYEIGFHLAPTPGERESLEEATARVQGTLSQLREQFGTTAFKLVDGVEFNITGTFPPMIEHAILGDSVVDPSKFQIPKDSRRQAYLLFEATSIPGHPFAIHLYLIHQRGKWAALSAHFTPQTVAGFTMDEITEASSKEYMDKHFVTCFLLLKGASQMTTPFYRKTPEQADCVYSVGDIGKQLGVNERPLVAFDLNDVSVEFFQIDLRVSYENTYVELHNFLMKLDDGEQMERFQEECARVCLELHPEWKKYFTGIAISTMSANPRDRGRGFRTAYMIEELMKPREGSASPDPKPAKQEEGAPPNDQKNADEKNADEKTEKQSEESPRDESPKKAAPGFNQEQ